MLASSIIVYLGITLSTACERFSLVRRTLLLAEKGEREKEREREVERDEVEFPDVESQKQCS